MERIHALLKSYSRDETIEAGKRLGSRLSSGDVVGLVGQLGSGKTTFVKGLAEGLGVRSRESVKSPTFVVMHQYPGKCPIYHLDLYRMETLDDVENLGWDDLLRGEGVVLVEWAEKIKGYLPKDYLEIRFTWENENERSIALTAHGKRYEKILQEIKRETKN